MNPPTTTPRTDAAYFAPGATMYSLAGDMKDIERELAAAKAECERLYKSSPTALDALTAELARLRAENSTLRAAQKACEACDEPTAFEVRQLRAEVERLTKQRDNLLKPMREQAIARAERAEAAETVALARWNGALERAMKAEAEVERLKELLRIESASAQHALAAAERAEADTARLDWLLEDNIVRFSASYSDRAAIDAAMKEGA